MSRRKGIMSEALKYEIAQELGVFNQQMPNSDPNDLKFEMASELGVYNTAAPSIDWGSVSSRDCGNMVKQAIMMAQKNLSLS